MSNRYFISGHRDITVKDFYDYYKEPIDKAIESNPNRKFLIGYCMVATPFVGLFIGGAIMFGVIPVLALAGSFAVFCLWLWIGVAWAMGETPFQE